MIFAKAIIDYEKNEYGSNEMKVCLHGKATLPLEKKVHKMRQHWNNTENIFFIVYCLSSVFHEKSCVNSLSTIQVELTPQKIGHHWDAFAHIYYDETWTLKWDSIIFEKKKHEFPRSVMTSTLKLVAKFLYSSRVTLFNFYALIARRQRN